MMGYEPRNIPQAFPDSNLPTTEAQVNSLHKIREEALACHSLAQQRMSDQTHEQKYRPWKVGDKVWLSANHLLTQLTKKLTPKHYGPFKVIEVLSHITFKLQLPTAWKVHPVFHASELVSYLETEVHGPNYTKPPPDLIDGEEHYKVEAIIQHKGTRPCQRYLVTWVGYPDSEQTWLPESELKLAAELLAEYKKKIKST
jgi:hypothetical protein